MTMGKSPTDILKEEHLAVLQKLDTLEQAVRKLDEKGSVSPTLKQMASFFERDFWVHFDKEENALFPEMETFMPRDAGPIGVMLYEHEDLRKTNQEMQKAIASYIADPAGSRADGDVRKYVTHFVGLLRDHISKEDGILFVMAEQHLDVAQMAKVDKGFARIDAAAAKAA